jgi:hypothetical protein
VEKEVKQSSVGQAIPTGCHHQGTLAERYNPLVQNSQNNLQRNAQNYLKSFMVSTTGLSVFHQNTLKPCSRISSWERDTLVLCLWVRTRKSRSSFHSSHCNQGELTNGNKDAVKLIKSDFKMEQHVLVMYMIGLLIENAGVCLNSLTLGLLCIQ